ncbi:MULTISPECIES: MarR family transcriptional regulator [unclassified Xanthobacter]|uniref:MarR family transcriptional regulator n=1 Tax=unclassified Xanthobacter TaxID=2623496 RepID=UPI001EDCDF3B|nr:MULTISPECIES: helix-turn-helix domain-containing protein [unclassified Xanthobacter]
MDVVRLLEPGPCLTTAELAERSGCSRHDIGEACGKLVRRGWVDRLERGCFTLSSEGRRALAAGEEITGGPRGPIAVAARRPKRRTIRDKMWSAIRMARKFDLARLEALAGATNANARRYVRALQRAGYLSELRRQPGEAATSNGFKRWLLVDDPGALAPIPKLDGRVWDPNRKQFRGAS